MNNEDVDTIMNILRNYTFEAAYIKYYPFCNINGKYKLDISCDKKKCAKIIRSLGENLHTISYDELHYRDMCARNNVIDNKTNYSIRKDFIIKLINHKCDTTSLITLELEIKCDEFDFPSIINYHHCSNYKVDYYEYGNEMTFEKVQTNDSIYIDMISKIDNDNTKNSIKDISNDIKKFNRKFIK